MSWPATFKATADELYALQRMIILGNKLWAGGQPDPKENHPDFEAASKLCRAIFSGYAMVPFDEKQRGN